MKWIGGPPETEMAGVTIGIGSFAGKAEIAARQFTWATGLLAAVIDRYHAMVLDAQIQQFVLEEMVLLQKAAFFQFRETWGCPWGIP